MTLDTVTHKYQTIPREAWTPNDWADFQRYSTGLNVIPATNNHQNPKLCKKPFWTDEQGAQHWIHWKEDGFQTEPITEEQHQEWKDNNAFKDGMALICGKIWHNKTLEGLWGNEIDCDNLLGIQEYCGIKEDGSPRLLAEVAKDTVVEQHSNKNKCHIIVNTDEPIQSKASLDGENIPKIEIKSGGNKLLYCAGGYHKDGSLIDIVDFEQVAQVPKDKLEKKIDNIFKKYGLTYLEVKKTEDSEILEKLKLKGVGTDRQGSLLSLGTKFALKTKDLTSEQQVIDYVVGLNKELGVPYPETRAIQIGKSCYKYAQNGQTNPEIEIKVEMKSNWEIIRDQQKSEDEKNTARANINELQKLLGVEVTNWNESIHIQTTNESDKKEKPDSVIFDKALELAEGFDHKESLKQLIKYNNNLETPYTDVKVKKFLSLAEKKIKDSINVEFAPQKKHDSPKQIRAYHVGEELIQKKIQNESDTEQVVVKVWMNGKPVWVDLFSSSFQQLLRVKILDLHGSIYGESVFHDAIKSLHAQALLGDIETKQIYKVCAMENDCLYYNTNDEQGTIYKVSKDGISKLNDDDVQPIFLKKQKMYAKINRVIYFDNPFAIKNFSKLCRIQEQDRIVFESHVICEFLKNIPIPIIIVHGEQGTAKTSVSNGVKYIVDPEVENSLSMPVDINDLVVTMSKREISSFDNIDTFEKITSDLLCRAVTGTMQSKRKLFTNSDSHDIYLKEKIIINGITPSVDQPDLVQRSIFYELLKIDEKDRLTDDVFLERLDCLRPYVVGHALQTVQKAMLILDEVKEEIKKKLPRMASFTVWGEAISRVLGNDDDVFLTAYKERLINSNLGLSQEYPIIKPLMSLVGDSTAVFKRGVSELFDLISPEDQWGKRKPNMPKDVSLFGRELKKIAPVLRSIGYELKSEIHNKKDGIYPRGNRIITITRITEKEGTMNGYF